MSIPAIHIAAEIISGSTGRNTVSRGTVEKIPKPGTAVIRLGTKVLNVRVPEGSLQQGDSVRAVFDGETLVLTRQVNSRGSGTGGDRWTLPNNAALIETLRSAADELKNFSRTGVPADRARAIAGALEKIVHQLPEPVQKEIQQAVHALRANNAPGGEAARAINRALELLNVPSAKPSQSVAVPAEMNLAPGFVFFDRLSSALEWLQTNGFESSPQISGGGPRGAELPVVVQIAAQPAGGLQAVILKNEQFLPELTQLLNRESGGSSRSDTMAPALARATLDLESVSEQQILRAVRNTSIGQSQAPTLTGKAIDDSLHQWFLHSLNSGNTAERSRGLNPLEPLAQLPPGLSFVDSALSALPVRASGSVKEIVQALSSTLSLGPEPFDLQTAVETLGLTMEKNLRSSVSSAEFPLSLKSLLMQVKNVLPQAATSGQEPAREVLPVSVDLTPGEIAARLDSMARELTSASSRPADMPSGEHGSIRSDSQLQRIAAVIRDLSQEISRLLTNGNEHGIDGAASTKKTTALLLSEISEKISAITKDLGSDQVNRGSADQKVIRAIELELGRMAEAFSRRDAMGSRNEIRLELPQTILMESVRGTVENSLSKLETMQMLARPAQTQEGSQQVLALPVRVDGEWSEMRLKFVKKDGGGRSGKPGKRRFGINLQTSPSALGDVGVQMDYEPGKSFRVAMDFGKMSSRSWFETHRGELAGALEALGLRGVQIDFRTKRTKNGAPAESAGSNSDQAIDITA